MTNEVVIPLTIEHGSDLISPNPTTIDFTETNVVTIRNLTKRSRYDSGIGLDEQLSDSIRDYFTENSCQLRKPKKPDTRLRVKFDSELNTTQRPQYKQDGSRRGFKNTAGEPVCINIESQTAAEVLVVLHVVASGKQTCAKHFELDVNDKGDNSFNTVDLTDYSKIVALQRTIAPGTTSISLEYVALVRKSGPNKAKKLDKDCELVCSVLVHKGNEIFMNQIRSNEFKSEQPPGPPKIIEIEPDTCVSEGDRYVILKGCNFLPSKSVSVSIISADGRSIQQAVIDKMTTKEIVVFKMPPAQVIGGMQDQSKLNVKLRVCVDDRFSDPISFTYYVAECQSFPQASTCTTGRTNYAFTNSQATGENTLQSNFDPTLTTVYIDDSMYNYNDVGRGFRDYGFNAASGHSYDMEWSEPDVASGFDALNTYCSE